MDIKKIAEKIAFNKISGNLTIMQVHQISKILNVDIDTKEKLLYINNGFVAKLKDGKSLTVEIK